MKMYFDRVEGALAVLLDENDTTCSFPLCDLPVEAKPGVWLVREEGSFRVDIATTEERRRRILSLQNKLRKK